MKAYKLQKARAYLKRYGVKKLLYKVIERRSTGSDYNENRKNEIVTEHELEWQRKQVFENAPVISIIMPAYNTPPQSLKETLLSVKAQSYSKWELCISDGGNISVKLVIDEIFGDDERIKYKKLNENLGISGNSNEALGLATGDFVAFLDHDDILEPNVLYEVASVIVNKGADMVYTDEDKVSESLDNYFRPYRKPDYNRELLLSNNYICHFCAISSYIIKKTDGFRSEYDGAQDYDLFLRCIEYATKIEHINKVLYHWRVSTQSTSDNPFNKEYAFLAGKRAIEDYLRRNGLDKCTEVVELEDPGYFRVEYKGDVNASVKVLKPKDEITEADYYLLIDDNMEMLSDWQKHLVGTALLTDADIVLPKIIKNRKYEYNGLARNGDKTTQSLKGCPMWYKGEFNLGITNMNVSQAPKKGILVSKQIIKKVKDHTGIIIDNADDSFKGIKIVYAPAAVLKIKK